MLKFSSFSITTQSNVKVLIILLLHVPYHKVRIEEVMQRGHAISKYNMLSMNLFFLIKVKFICFS